MKFNFKKIVALGTSALMTLSGIGFAAAANYPAPFVSGGTANVAIVYGTGAAVSAQDIVAASNIQSNLQSFMTGTSEGSSSSASDNDKAFLIELASTKFRIGRGIKDVISGTLTDSELKTLLQDGEYLDDNKDTHEYTQKISLANLSLGLFEDSDYKTDVPTVGIRAASGSYILNYTLEFTSNPEWEDIQNTEIEIMGKEYFISSVTTNTTMNLLDAANTGIVNEGETKTITVGDKSYEVSISTLSGGASSPQVRLVVNGVPLSKSLAEGETLKIADSTYVGIKDISMRDVAGTVASVEFSIGTGKIELRDGLPVKMNENTVNGLNAYFTNPASTSPQQLNKIVLEWKADDDIFATEDTSMIMPGFKNIKIDMAKMNYPTEETFEVEKGSNTYVRLKGFPLKDGVTDIDLLYGNGTAFSGTGKESGKGLLTVQGTGKTITFDADDYQNFIATYDDGTNAESYLMRATSFGIKSDGIVNTTDIQYYKDGAWVSKKSEAAYGDSINLGSVTLTIGAIHRTNKAVAITAGSNVYFDRVYTKEGLGVYLPVANTTADLPSWPQFQTNATAVAANVTASYPIGFVEESVTGGKMAGTAGLPFNVTVGWTSNKATVTDIIGETPNGGYEIEDSDVMRSFIYGPLATELLYDTGGDQDSVKITYHGDESYGEVWVSAIDTTISSTVTPSGTTSLGEVLVKDSEISSVSTKNLIVVGGSCINSAAANLVGGAYCGAAFTEATGVGSGQYMIKSYSGKYATGKIALLVAGYEIADTANGATYLRTQTVDTGKSYIGTSATSATEQSA